jgi:hypothetical protein
MLDKSHAADLVAGHNAPLGTFSARTTACFVLDLVTDREPSHASPKRGEDR